MASFSLDVEYGCAAVGSLQASMERMLNIHV
jgi:hypothetical protein